MKISLENNDEKILKDFIVNPNKTKISDLKIFLCKEYNFKETDYIIYKTNSYGDPCKAIKNENQIISNAGLKDTDLINLKNVSAEINEIYHLSLYKSFNHEDECSIKNKDLLYTEKDIQEINNPKSFIFNEITKDNFLFDISVKIYFEYYFKFIFLIVKGKYLIFKNRITRKIIF